MAIITPGHNARFSQTLMSNVNFGSEHIPEGQVYVEPATLVQHCCREVLKLWESDHLTLGQLCCLLQHWLYYRAISDASPGLNGRRTRRIIDFNHQYLLNAFMNVAVHVPDFLSIADFKWNPDVAFERQVFNLIWLHRDEHLQFVSDLLSVVCHCLNQSPAHWLTALVDLDSRPFFTAACSFYTSVDEWIVSRLQDINEHPDGVNQEEMRGELGQLQRARD